MKICWGLKILTPISIALLFVSSPLPVRALESSVILAEKEKNDIPGRREGGATRGRCGQNLAKVLVNPSDYSPSQK